jgi:hypothetical protein
VYSFDFTASPLSQMEMAYLVAERLRFLYGFTEPTLVK